MKSRILTAVLVCAALLAGCSNGKVDLSKVTDSTVGINSDGTVEELVVEAFDKEYYSLEELTSYVNEEVADFNTKHPIETAGDKKSEEDPEAVTVRYIQVNEQDQMIHLALSYSDIDIYDAFNDANISYSMLEEALSAGVVAEDQLLVNGKNQETVSVSDITEAEKLHAVITDSAMRIQTGGRIAYYSEGAELLGRNEVQTSDEQTIIIFK